MLTKKVLPFENWSSMTVRKIVCGQKIKNNSKNNEQEGNVQRHFKIYFTEKPIQRRFKYIIV